MNTTDQIFDDVREAVLAAEADLEQLFQERIKRIFDAVGEAIRAAEAEILAQK